MKRTSDTGKTAHQVFLVLLSCFVLVLQVACGGTYVASDLSEDEAQEALVVLQRFGIDAEKEKLGEGKEATWNLMVPSDKAHEANQILEKYELPRKKPRGFDEVFGESGLIPTATEEKAKFLVALQGEISQTLETVDGVISARVHIVIPEKDPLAADRTEKASSGVFIKYRGEQQPLTIEEIKQIVSHAVDDLDQAGVAVVMKKIKMNEPMGEAPETSDAGQPSFLTVDRARIIVPILAVICLFLAVILVVLLKNVQSEKRKRAQLQRELAMLSAGTRK
jgi:type III secretion protein J